LTNNARILIKLLTSAGNKINPAVKIELTPEKEDSLLNFTFNNIDKRRISINDILEGKRVNSSSISPSGRFVLLSLRETMKGGENRNYTEIYDTRQKRTVLSETANRSQLNWMPKSDILYYVADNNDGRTMYTFDPLTSETKIIAQQLPKENFHVAPDEKSVFYSSKETLSVTTPSGLRRLIGIDDRQAHYRDRFYLYLGRQTATLNDVTDDVKYLLFSTSGEDLSQRPFSKSNLYMLNLETMAVDTVWKDQTYTYSAQFSPDGKQLLIHGAPEAFNGIGLNVKEGQIANSYDTQSFIMDLATRRVDPVTKHFDPAINAQEWNSADHSIYYRVEEGDRANVYRYSPKTKKFDKLPLKEDVIRSFSISGNGRWAQELPA